MRLDFCVHHVFEKGDTSFIERMQEVLDKDNVSSFVQFQSCCVTHDLSVCAIVFISNLLNVTCPWSRPHTSLSVVSHTCVPYVSAILQSWVLCGLL